MNESCHVHLWVMSHIRMSHLMSHICTRHVTHTRESCHTNESQCCHWWVTCTICHTDKSCVACMSSWLTILPAGCTWMSHVSQINGVCHTREQKKQLTILPVWAPKTNKKTYSHHKWVMNEYWHRYEWVIRVWMLPKKKLTKKKTHNLSSWELRDRLELHLYVWHDSFIRVTWIVGMCDISLIRRIDTTHSYVWHGSFICVTWLIHVCDMTYSCVQHESFVCMTYMWHDSLKCSISLIRMSDVIHSYVRHDSFMCVTWLLHMCDMTQWRGSFICVTCLIYLRDMTHSNIRYHSFVWLIHICDMKEWHGSFICVTWLIDAWCDSLKCVTYYSFV